MNLQSITNVYFIGIGGIGMSALARYFNANGKVVAGYDRTPTDITEMLEKEGIKVHFTDEVKLYLLHSKILQLLWWFILLLFLKIIRN